MTCTATYTITQADLDSRLGDEHRQGFGQRHRFEHRQRDGHRGPEAGAQRGQVRHNHGDYHAGQAVPYTFVVTNIGNVTLSGITVSDPKCDATPAYLSGDLGIGDGQLQLA